MTDSDSLIRHAAATKLTGELHRPFRIATGEHKTLNNILFTITLGDGTKGVGEAAVASHITGESWGQTWRSLDRIARILTEKNAEDYLSISAWLNDQFAENKAAVAAAETALMDALCRQWKQPLWRLFGPAARRLKTDITIGLEDLSRTEKTARAFYKRGFRSFKIKIGKDYDSDIKRIITVRKNTGRSQLILDANQSFSSSTMLKMLNELRRKRIVPDLVEQPVPKEDLDGLKRVSRNGRVAVCADESAASLVDCLCLLKGQYADVINIKLMKFGLFHAREAARLVAHRGVGLMMGAMMESIVATTASAHMAAAIDGFRFIDLDTAFFIKGGVRKQNVLVGDGTYDVTRVRAGLGVVG